MISGKTTTKKRVLEIKKGNIASLISINPEKLTDNATYENPKAFSDGIKILDFK